jgi:membrane protease YdiL (CAAX protease family)
LLIFVLGTGVGILLFLTPLSPMKLTNSMLANQLIQLVTFTGSIYLARRLLDRRSFVSLGLRWDRAAIRDVFVGIGIAAVMMALIFVIHWAVGWLTFESFAWQTRRESFVLEHTLLALLIFVLVGWNEELLSRGYHLQTLESGLNRFWGVLLSSAVFAVLHLANPNANWNGAAGILLAGLFLAYGYLRTEQLWLPIGLHIGWNFFEGVVFGFPVSGLNTFSLIRIDVAGPTIWTGGAFGPEAGLVLLPGLLLGTALIWLYTGSGESGVESQESGVESSES